MPISGNWKKDKQKLLSSLYELDMWYFDKLTYTDASEEIMASFENLTAGDFDDSGWVTPYIYNFDEGEGDLYRSSEPDSMTNYRGRFYFDENSSNRVYFQVISSNFIEDDFGNEGLNGNVPSAGELITLTGTVLNGTYMVHESTPLIPYYQVGVETLYQIPGQIWLKNVTDLSFTPDAEYGINWDNEWNVPGGSQQWSAIQAGWTESEITINKADFWGRDKFTPDV